MRPSKRLAIDEWPNLSEIDNIAGKLAGAVEVIKREAAGRVCGSCKHLRQRWCAEKRNIDGNELVVLYPGAVACGQHEVRT
jgi:hypothetical protein